MRKNYTKIEAAKNQLERGLSLYLDEQDYLAAITLAGASEEILGKMLEGQGGKNALKSLSSAVAAIQIQSGIFQPVEKKIIGELNKVRDWLKHYQNGGSLEFDAKEDAKEFLDRAISNYFALTGDETELMRRFKEQGV